MAKCREGRRTAIPPALFKLAVSGAARLGKWWFFEKK